MVFLSSLTRFTLTWVSNSKFWILACILLHLTSLANCLLSVHFVGCLNGSWPNFSALVLLIQCSKDTKFSALLSQMDCYPSLGFLRMGFFSRPEAVVTCAELLLGLEAGEGVLVVRDISEASRRGSLAGCSPLVVAVPWPSSLPDGQWEPYSPVGWGEQQGHCSTPANALPSPMALLSETFQGLKGKRETERGQETKGGIKSKNVPWSFLQQNAEKVISNFFHLRDEATK